MSKSPLPTRRRAGVLAVLVATLVTLGAGLLVPAVAGAQDAESAPAETARRPQLTDEQRQCLRDQGLERPARGERPTSPIDETGTWLRINVGKNVGVLPKDVVGCLAGESGLDSSVIGQIQILPTITLVQVAAESAEHLLTSINGARMCGRTIGASVGSPPKPMGDRPPGVGYGGPPRREGGGYGGGGGGFGGPRREGGGYGAGGPRYGKPGGGYRGNRD